MGFIVASSTRREIGYIDPFIAIDFELGGNNDFEITLNLDDWSREFYDYGHLVYRPNTEYGGIIEDMEVNTKDNTIKLRGYTWRGLLTQKIIEPPSGEPYKTVNGEANSIIRDIVSDEFGDLFVVDDIDSGITLNYRFNRYVTVLEGLERMLKIVNHRLDIKFDNIAMQVKLQAVPIIDYSDEIEYSQDYQLDFITRDYRCGINHLICLGSGELENREVIHLYMHPNGSISDTKHYTGLDERVAVFDYPNVETTEELIASGTEKLIELSNFKKLDMDIENIPAEIGDIVGGRERVTEMAMKEPITQKILRIERGIEQIQFKVGDE